MKTLSTLALLVALTAPAAAADPFDDLVRPFLAKHCQSCHGGAKPKGDFRVDRLSSDLADAAVRARWFAALTRVQAGEMPPETKPRPSEKEVRDVADWLAARRAAAGRAVLRRLNRVEYENTVRDLLGIPIELRDLLPEDSSSHGFDNVGEALHTSSFLMEKYLEAADLALGKAIAGGKQPPLVKKRLLLKDERHVKHTTERVFRHADDALIMFSSSAWQAITLSQFYPPDRGAYRFRLHVSAVQSGGKPVVFRVEAGPMLMATRSRLVGYFDAPADTPAVVEFVEPLEARSTIRILPYGLTSAQAVDKVGADAWNGPGLVVHAVEVEGPLHDRWPPESHRRLLGDPADDATTVLRRFARRAFRRTVTDAELAPILALVNERRAAGHSAEQALRVGLAALLVSPDFLFLREKPGKLDDFALASRLAYFLWSTAPDDELLALAEKNDLGKPEVLRAQVERLLRSPKADAFAENFVGQWLGLRDIDFTEPSHILYPEFDHLLKVSMVREAELFFREILKDDLSPDHFIASDFALLNGRLARHYGIPGVEGYAFRKVALPADSHRGGVLTMAAVLKVTANGTTTSPVTRGAWVLDRLLSTPPPRPPADVPAVEPDIRGATTIREQLAKHRRDPACAACHTLIDPAGFALESFDVIGGWRDHYRTTGRGAPVTVDGRRMHYLKGPKVDPSGALADGRSFQDIDELKKHLLRDRDHVARALAERLLTYATGAVPAPTDRPRLDALVRAMRASNGGLRSLIHGLVQSDLFRHK